MVWFAGMGKPNSTGVTLKMDDIPSAPQKKPMNPTTPSLPSKDLTPILPPPHIIQLYLPVRALHHPPLIET